MIGEIIGLRVSATDPASMQVIVEPGAVTWRSGTKTSLTQRIILEIKEAGTRKFENHSYVIRGEGDKSPSFWNGEEIRGSGGVPYQRMVTGTLRVYNSDRSVLYEPDQDYVSDYYWGTIKRKRGGAIQEGEMLSIDYSVWLCRYDAIVIDESGRIRVVEGTTEAPESRELLLPDPPVVGNGFVVAHVFVGWGTQAITDGNSRLVACEPHAVTPRLRERYLDMTERCYLIETLAPDPADTGGLADSFLVSTAASGEEYGTGETISIEHARRTDPVVVRKSDPVPLLLQSAYGFAVDWGLELDFSESDRIPQPGESWTVVAEPHCIFDLRNRKGSMTENVAMSGTGAFADWRNRLSEGGTVRLAFFGESTTRSGRWPYRIAEGLRTMYPQTRICTSNVAVGGETSIRGIRRLQSEVLMTEPDFVFIEYSINDACSGKMDEVSRTIEEIVLTVRRYGAKCAIITANGMNPQFGERCSMRNFRKFHTLFQQLAEQHQVPFIGAHEAFERLHENGLYFLTELKGNMVNHPYGNVDPKWGCFDKVISEAFLQQLRHKSEPSVSCSDHAATMRAIREEL